jgi:hypothetical protein
MVILYFCLFHSCHKPLFTSLSYYTLGNVCVCVCLSVCPAIHVRLRISQMILSKLGGIIPWVMTRLMDYLQTCWEYTTNHHKLHEIYSFHVQAPHARVRVRVCECARGSAFSHLWTDSLQMCREHTMNHHKLHGLRIFNSITSLNPTVPPMYISFFVGTIQYSF